MHPIDPTGAEGSAEGPISKPMDKPKKQYTANETVPEDDYHAETPPDLNARNSHEASHRFA